MEPIRVLQVCGEPFAGGGQESYLMNMYRHIDRERVQFDFYTPFENRAIAMQREIESLGGHLWASGFPFGEDNREYFRRGLSAFLAGRRYPIVHIHSGSIYALATGARLARQSGAERVIVHSHCGGFDNLRYRVARLWTRQTFLTYPTHYFACSHLAARWKFPPSVIRTGNYTVLKNAVDTAALRYDPTLRQATRLQLGLGDKPTVGHVGRFALQKNHRFLIEIFHALTELEPDAQLVLAGEGDLVDEVLEQIDKLGLEDRVHYLGPRRDIPALMNAFDVLLLPSFFEGLPVVGVEAQAAGLPVITSTGVTRELPIDELSTYLPLTDTAMQWARVVQRALATPRRDTSEEMVRRGYDVETAARVMQQMYEEMM
jgi:glycosyltransferase involved in cell wall biosynthesis